MKYSARTSDEIKISRKVLFIFGNLIVLDYGLPDRLSSRIELENDVEAEIVFYENVRLVGYFRNKVIWLIC